MKFKPTHDRLLVRKLDQEEEQSKGGIILPSSTLDKNVATGEVTAVGPGRQREDGGYDRMSVNVGDTAVFAAHLGLPVKEDGVDYLLLTDFDILGTLQQ